MMNYQAILDHYHQPVPRYTSYPTAPQFKPDIGKDIFKVGMDILDPERSVSVYIHIPFCDRLCWFCGCHTKHTLKYAPVAQYVRVLTQELDLFAQKYLLKPKLGQLHLGVAHRVC